MHFRAMGRGPAWTRLIAQRRLARFGIFGEGRLLGRRHKHRRAVANCIATARPSYLIGAFFLGITARSRMLDRPRGISLRLYIVPRSGLNDVLLLARSRSFGWDEVADFSDSG